MNILVLNYEYPPVGGGGATVCAQLGRHLVQRGHRIEVVTMHCNGLAKEETVDGVRIHRTWAYRRRSDRCTVPEMGTYLLGSLGPALRLARQNRYDVIHAHFIIPTSPLAWRLRRRTGIPYVLTCHGSDVPGHNPDRFQVAHKLLLPLWKPLVAAADCLVSPSCSLGEKIRRHSPEADIRIIPNGFDASAWNPNRPRSETILLCGRLLSMKGFQYVLEAAKDLDPRWQIHVVGDGPFRPVLEKAAARCAPAVHFHGWLDRDDPKLRDLYETAAIFAFPAESENFPTVLLEAMAAGAAILTSTAGGCPEVVGEAALLAEPKKPQAVREQLLRLTSSEPLRRELSQAAQRRIRQFSWTTVADRYLETFQEAIERARTK